MKRGCCYATLVAVALIAVIFALFIFYVIQSDDANTADTKELGTTRADNIEIYQPSKPCRLQKVELGYVCVCDSDYCDTLDVEEPAESKQYILVTTSDAGDRFSYIKGTFTQGDTTFDCQKNRSDSSLLLRIDQQQIYQEIIGFGGSFTGSVSYILDRLPQKVRECVYKSYYSSDVGMGYTLLRIPIGRSDFDLDIWYYNEFPINDARLSNFTKLDRRDMNRNEHIKALMNVSNNHAIKICAAAWSPPAWMKINDPTNLTQHNHLKLEYYQTWADYHLRYIELMAADGISIWSVSTGNEPVYARVFAIEGKPLYRSFLAWHGGDQSKYIYENLGPTLNASKFRVQIHAYDDCRNGLIEFLNEMNESNHKAMDYISMIDVHGYTDYGTPPSVLDETHKNYPNKPILYTETSQFKTPQKYKSWLAAANFSSTLIETLTHHVVGYIDWNAVLNATGGPRTVDIKSGACIMANEDFTKIEKTPIFYATAQFSKFIPVGSKRIDATICGNEYYLVEAIAFLRPDRKVSVVLHNNSTETIKIDVSDQLVGSVNIEIKPKSVNTLVYSID